MFFIDIFQEISGYSRQKPSFFIDGATRFDVKQGSLGLNIFYSLICGVTIVTEYTECYLL
jgi:hypothetical protein